MKTSELEGAELDYWVARGLHDFIREIHFTDGGQTLAIRGNDRGRAWDGRFLPSTSWEAASVVLGGAGRRCVLRCCVRFCCMRSETPSTTNSRIARKCCLGNGQNRWGSRARRH